MQATERSAWPPGDDCLVPLVVGATGHRTLGTADVDLSGPIAVELGRMQSRYRHSPFIVLSALAEGADRLIARLAMEHLGARLVAPLPLSPEEYEKDFADPASRAEFREMLRSATWFVLPVPDGEDPAVDGEARRRAYARVGAYVAERCQTLVAIWDGEPARGLGGTADVVRWAETGRTPPEFSVSALAAPELAAAEPVLVVHAHSQTGMVEHRPVDPALRADIEARSMAIDDFNRAVRAVWAQGGMSAGEIDGSSLLHDRAPNAPLITDPAVRRLAAVHGAASALARRERDASWRMDAVLYATFAAAVLALAAVNGIDHAIFVYIALLLLWALLYRRKRRSGIEDRFLEHRALAEGLRVAVYWRLGDVAAHASDHYLSKHRGLVAWIRRAIRNAELAAHPDPRPGPPSSQGLDLVRRLWIEGQRRFFEDRGTANARRAAAFDRITRASFLLSVSIGAVFALYVLKPRPFTTAAEAVLGTWITAWHWGAVFQTSMGLCLAAGAAAQAWSAKRAFRELERQYRLAGIIYARAADRLKSSASPRDILLELGREALAENGEWLWLHRNLDDEAPR